MTTTPGVGASGGALGVFRNDPASTLTNESLLVYCQSQLASLDGTIKGYMEEQKLNIARKKVLSDLESNFKKYDPSQTATGWDGTAKAFDDAIAALPEGDPLRATLQAKHDEIWDRYSTSSPNFIHRGPSKEEWEGYTGDLHGMLEDLSGNAEINMIQIQSLMSQRQTAVQLTTSMMAKEDEGIRSILKNL